MEIDDEITLKKLQIFLAYMRNGNLSKTSYEIEISTVSIHKALHSLEEALRCPLFKNEGRNLVPLKSAYVLEEKAKLIIRNMVSTVNETREAAGFASKMLKLGSLFSLTVKTVPAIISGLKLRRGELDIQLLLSSNIDLVKKIKESELDAAIIALNATTNQESVLEQLPIFSDEIFLAVDTNSKYSDYTEIDLKYLKDETFLTLSQGFSTRDDSDIIFEKAEIKPNVFLEVSDIFTLISMVSSGVGYALLPGRISKVYEGSVKLIPLKKEYKIKQTIGLVFLKSKERDPNILALIAECRMLSLKYDECRNSSQVALFKVSSSVVG